MNKFSLLLLISALTSSNVFASTKRIIGKDTRYQVTDAKAQTVHDSIGMLKIRYGDEMGQCTGTVIGPRHVLTAAHCLIDDAGKAQLAVFYPGLRDDVSKRKYPFGYFRSTNFKIHPSFAKTRKTMHDIAVIIFNENLPVEPLAIARSVNPKASIKIAGYPGDKISGQLWEASGNRFQHFFESHPNSHNVDTVSGQSGSAVRSGAYVVGVHSAGMNGLIYEYNLAHMFDLNSLELIRSWLK